jgi:hypothetical protein
MNLLLLGFAALAIFTVETDHTSAQEPNLYYCSFKSADDQKFSNAVGLVMVRRPKTETSSETWLLQWSGKPEYDALAFEYNFGRGGSNGLQWKDESDKLNRGFILHSDIVAKNGSRGLWFTLDRPSLWRAPGYGCETDVRMITGTPK